MAMSDYARDMEGCSRCASCKWVCFDQMKSWRFARNCPSVSRYNFHAYAGGGRMVMGLSMLQGRSELNEAAADIIYRCNMCGACDTACKVYRDDMDLTEAFLEMRTSCVDAGQLVPEHMLMVDAMKKEDNVLGEPKADRGKWAEGLGVKDVNTTQSEVLFHAGCRYSYDRDHWPGVRGAVRLMRKAGVDVGIAGGEESCCGGRAYELGYRGEAANFADAMLGRVKSSGASILVTACSDCYAHFKYAYPRTGRELPVEVMHVTEYLDRLVGEGRLRLERAVPLAVTYHDPCHLGRMSEPFRGEWADDKLLRPMSMKRGGHDGIFDQPRRILQAIPGVELREMERIREWSWCCGAGGGVLEAYPDFATWTAGERIEEARSTGAEALVTACPWCLRLFRDTLEQSGSNGLELYDLTELVCEAAALEREAG